MVHSGNSSNVANAYVGAGPITPTHFYANLQDILPYVQNQTQFPQLLNAFNTMMANAQNNQPAANNPIAAIIPVASNTPIAANNPIGAHNPVANTPTAAVIPVAHNPIAAPTAQNNGPTP